MSPVRVEYLNLELPEADRKWVQVSLINPGETLTFSNYKTVGGMTLMTAYCAENDRTSFITRLAENQSGSVSEGWDLMFNPPDPILDKELSNGESHIITGLIEGMPAVGMIKFTHQVTPSALPEIK